MALNREQDILRYEGAAAILPLRLRKAALELPPEVQRRAEEFRLRAGPFLGAQKGAKNAPRGFAPWVSPVFVYDATSR